MNKSVRITYKNGFGRILPANIYEQTTLQINKMTIGNIKGNYAYIYIYTHIYTHSYEHRGLRLISQFL